MLLACYSIGIPNSLGLRILHVAEIGGAWNLVAAFSEGNIFLFLLLVRVVSFNMAPKWFAQVLSMMGEEIFFLQLKYGLLQLKYVLPDAIFGCQFESLVVDFIRFLKEIFNPAYTSSILYHEVHQSRVIIDRQDNNVHHILLKKFRKFSVLIFSVHTYVSTRLYHARIDIFQQSPLLTSETFWRFLIQEGVIMTVGRLKWSYIHTFCTVGYFQNQVTYILMWVSFLRWKYKLYFTGLWSALNVSERHCKMFVGVYFSLARLVSSYCTSAGNVFLQKLKVEGVQVFLNSIVSTGPFYLHYAHYELYGCIHLWISKGGNCFSLYFVYNCYFLIMVRGLIDLFWILTMGHLCMSLFSNAGTNGSWCWQP
ncbi:uncharacterized protein LOC113309976 [Papaver somniferum]|uniref:uncharacterized protein LOC113309976 n=1 Tax=Papaver somniferum TaxID=3469 RepID=UPI000E6FD130|nr:uncharacterized protein LOC113309976 [Papaver somniferum]XP_026414298.1 uncharacterized protein LOC113309976 [Papaver somniferum]